MRIRLLTYHVLRGIVDADVDSTYIFPNQSQHNHQHAADKDDSRHQRAESQRHAGIDQFFHNGINSVEKPCARKGNTCYGGNAQRQYGECRETVKPSPSSFFMVYPDVPISLLLWLTGTFVIFLVARSTRPIIYG